MDFVDDRDGCLFTARVHRKTAISSEKMDLLPLSSEKVSGKTVGGNSSRIETG